MACVTPPRIPNGIPPGGGRTVLQQQLELRPQDELAVVTRLSEDAGAAGVDGAAVGEPDGVEGELGGVLLEVVVHADRDLVHRVLDAGGGAQRAGGVAVEAQVVVAAEYLPPVVQQVT